MVINRKELLENLKMAMPGIETGTTKLQGADTFVFKDGKIFTYNDTISVSVPINQTDLIEENIEGAVSAEEFYKIISKLPGEEIKFAVGENGKSWILKAGKARIEMTLVDFDYESRLKDIQPGDDWIKVPPEFIGALGTCKMAVNKTSFNGVFVTGKTAFSTDGMQINKCDMKETELPDFWLSDSVLNEVLKLTDIQELQIQGSWIHFRTGSGVLFSVKTLNTSSYPIQKISKLMDISNPKETDFHATLPKELFNVIDRAVSFSIDISERTAVRLTISKDNIEVSSERASGKFSEKVSWEDKIDQDFEPFVVYVDSVMMNYVSTKSLEFYIISSGRLPRILFISENSKHLMSTLDNGSAN